MSTKGSAVTLLECRPRCKAVLGVAALLLLIAPGCASNRTSTIATAQEFRNHIANQRYDEARALMSDSPRRWFDGEEANASPWRIGSGAFAPWAAWDEHFRKRTRTVGWEATDRAAILTFCETNDYFQLLDRGWVTNQAVYLFDENGQISGLEIRGIGDRPPGRTEEFLRWAQSNEPAELAYLRPGGRIDPSGDRPGRHRALLTRWRRSAGLPAIE